MSDLIKPIVILRDYLRIEFNNMDINIMYFISVMRNYICRIKNHNILIRLNELEILFKNQKDMYENNFAFDFCNTTETEILCKNHVLDYINKKNNDIGIAEIQNNCERYFGLILKFYRPVAWKLSKRTTIKVLRSGKINIDGGNSIEESFQLYHWLEYILTEFSNLVLFDSNKEIVYEPDNISCSESSIYDDEL